MEGAGCATHGMLAVFFITHVEKPLWAAFLECQNHRNLKEEASGAFYYARFAARFGIVMLVLWANVTWMRAAYEVAFRYLRTQRTLLCSGRTEGDCRVVSHFENH